MSDTTPEMVQPAPAELQETAPEPPKKRGRPVGSKNKTGTRRGRKRKSLEDKIGGVLTMVNLVFAFAPKELQGDALDAVEISALAKSLNEAALENPTLYKYLDMVLGGSGSAMVNLGVVAACIAGRRMARRGIIVGEEWDTRIGVYLQMNTGTVPESVDFAAIFDPASVAAAEVSDDTHQD